MTTPLITAADVTATVTVQTRTSLSPDEAFRIIVPIDLPLVFKRWGPFPGVRAVADQTGPWNAAGRTRTPHLTDGTTARERLTEYTAPHSFAYEITDFTNLLRHLATTIRGEWTFTPDGPATLIRWTYEFHLLPHRRPFLTTFVAPFWRHHMTRTLHVTTTTAEHLATT